MTFYSIARVGPEDTRFLAQLRDSLVESRRVLSLPYWPRDYFPPSVPVVLPTHRREDQDLARICGAIADPRSHEGSLRPDRHQDTSGSQP